jgi:hypothetical protein
LKIPSGLHQAGHDGIDLRRIDPRAVEAPDRGGRGGAADQQERQGDAESPAFGPRRVSEYSAGPGPILGHPPKRHRAGEPPARASSGRSGSASRQKRRAA